MAKDNQIPKYLFIFNKGKLNEVVLPGKEIQDYWNLIFDLLWEEEKMVVQKLNGENFIKKEIHELFWDLCENMWGDLSIIKLDFISFSTLEFSNLGEIDMSFIKKKRMGYKLDKESSKTIDEFIEKTRLRICRKFLSKAMASYNQKEYKDLTKGFVIENPISIRNQKYSNLKRALKYYQKANSNKDQWAYYLYHIVGRINNKSPKIHKTCKLLNDISRHGSRHEGEGFRKKVRMKEYSEREITFCNNAIKDLINFWIIKSGVNNEQKNKKSQYCH